MATSLQATGEGPAILGRVGSVEDVIAAKLSPEMTARRYQAGDFKMGFELATPKNLLSLGEAVIANGYCFANSTDRTSAEYDRTISGKEFISGGVFLVPKEAKPSHRFEVHGKFAMIDFYKKLDQELSRPLVFAGIFHFPDFHGTAIGKPPIDGHNIFTYKQEYYPNPDVHQKDCWGFVIGALTNFEGYPQINEELKAVLYKNPMDAKSQLIHHAHVLLLKKKIERIEEIVPSNVDRTLHLFIDGTSILSGKGEIFTVGGVKDYLMQGKKMS
jgi:hypothetical protein